MATDESPRPAPGAAPTPGVGASTFLTNLRAAHAKTILVSQNVAGASGAMPAGAAGAAPSLAAPTQPATAIDAPAVPDPSADAPAPSKPTAAAATAPEAPAAPKPAAPAKAKAVASDNPDPAASAPASAKPATVTVAKPATSADAPASAKPTTAVDAPSAKPATTDAPKPAAAKPGGADAKAAPVKVAAAAASTATTISAPAKSASPRDEAPEAAAAATKAVKPIVATPAPKAITPEPAVPSAGAVANAARMRRRHWAVILSFLLLVVAPLATSAWYLWTRAADQFASQVSFSVRNGESRGGGGADLLGRLSRFSGTNSTDTDILYQFIQSQELVARIDARLDLRAMYSRHYDQDPVFSFHPEGTIEDLVAYWTRMVRISYDANNGLMGLRVLAFEAREAQMIAEAITDESVARINELSAVARDDATRYAREELDQAVDRLRNAREAVTQFRSLNQIVDPLANIQGQMGLLNTLQEQLASALIDLDLLRETARDSDPRITQLERRIEVIRARIAEERAQFGVGTQGVVGDGYAALVGEFERLNVDREFAEQSYRSALMGYDVALGEAERTSRYLAAHITPTLAESSRYPERILWFAGLTLFVLLVWAVGVLIYYSIRDRR